MKILVLNGSPKQKSDTFRMTDAFLKGLNRAQENEVHIINVIDRKISPCRGCFGCWQKLDGIGQFLHGEETLAAALLLYLTGARCC